jgi:cytochrome P450
MMRSKSRDAQPPARQPPPTPRSRPMTEVAPGCPVNAAFDPLSPAYLDDPCAIMAALPLAEAPIFYAPSIGYHVVTRHADIAQVFDDPATYSAAVARSRPGSCSTSSPAGSPACGGSPASG